MGKNKVSPEKYILSIAGCKESRRIGMCERKCSFWHPKAGSTPAFCKSAECFHNKTSKRNTNACYNSKH